MGPQTKELELADTKPLVTKETPQKAQESTFRNLLGLLLMLIAQVLNALALAEAKYIYRQNSTLTAFEVLACSRLIHVVLYQCVMGYMGLSLRQIKRDQLKKLAWRFSLGFPAWTMLYYSVKVLPIGLSQTIQNLQPFLTLIFAFCLLKESVKRLEVYNMIASFLGVLIMIGFSSNLSMSEDYSALEFAFALFCNGLSTVSISLVNVILRSLKDLHFIVAAAFQALCGLFAASLLLLFYRGFINRDFDYSTVTGNQYFLLFLNGMIQAVVQMLWIKALQLDKAGRAASIMFLGIVAGYIYDQLIFGYEMQVHEILGAGLIVSCSCIVFALKVFKYAD